MTEIRETELNSSGGFKEADLFFKDPSLNNSDQVYVDLLGRIVTPHGPPWTLLEAVFLHDEPHVFRKVLKKEVRYAGDKAVATVIYLEPVEEDNNA